MIQFASQALALAVLGSLTTEAQAHFCRQYAQFWSTGGRCSECRISITKTQAGNFLVKANNGWSAVVREEGQTGRALEGRGGWSSRLRHRYAGKPFRIALTRRDDKLVMGMQVYLGGQTRSNLLAAFRCVDKGSVDELAAAFVLNATN